MRYYMLFEDTLLHDRKFDLFMEQMVRKTDPKLVNFLFTHPLYRAMKPNPKWLMEFGIKKIIKNRIPKNNTKVFQNLIDDYLRKNNFIALRSNSIFVTGSKEFATRILEVTDSLAHDIYVIFPVKNFHFTWNRKIKDFYIPDIESMISNKQNVYDIFLFNYQTLIKDKKALLVLIKFIIEKFSSELSKEDLDLIVSSVKSNNKENLIEILKKYEKEKFYNISIFMLMDYFIDKSNNPESYFIVNEKSEYVKNFTDKNFEEAVTSGNEIMITDTEYFYISEEFFNRYMDIIYEKYFNTVKYF